MIQTWRALLSFRGRAVRLRYWVTTLVALLMIVLAFMLAIGASRFAPVGPVNIGIFVVLMVLAFAVFVLMIWLFVAVMVRRLHDRNWSGWWAIPILAGSLVPDLLERVGDVSLGVQLPLLLLSAIVGIWSLIELGFLRGTAGENRFGPDPLASKESVAAAFD
jgi:uncharacterized membrane protein YhaH (DUF805 family)